VFVVETGKVLKTRIFILYKPFSYRKDLCTLVEKCGNKISLKEHSTLLLNPVEAKLKEAWKIVMEFNYYMYNFLLDFTLCKHTFPHFTAFQRKKTVENTDFV